MINETLNLADGRTLQHPQNSHDRIQRNSWVSLASACVGSAACFLAVRAFMRWTSTFTKARCMHWSGSMRRARRR
jgi:hypothetical protein